MLDYVRYALYITLAIISVFLYQTWEKEHPQAQNIIKEKQVVASSTTPGNYIPEITQTNNSAKTASLTQAESATPLTTSQNIIHIATDLLNVDIDKLGGNIIRVTLPKYKEQQNSVEPFILLNNKADTRYIAQSGLLSTLGPDTAKGQAIYTSHTTDYALSENQNEINVTLDWKNDKGLTVSKIFTFKRGSYEIGVDYRIQNQSNQAWNGNTYLQLMRKNTPPSNTQGFINFATYFGAAISSPDKRFQKISFTDMAKQNTNQTITGGWAAMIQHYFVSAWVPDTNVVSQYFSKVTNDGLYTIGMIGPSLQATTGQTIATHATFYAGPAIADQLEKAAPSLKLTIDYGWFWFISGIIFWMMQHIYNVIGNWGWSIVLVTLVIKLMFYHLSAKSYRSMSGLKKLQPKIAALKERFGDDKQKFTQATLELYKKEKVNPMSGCLPILVQIPVFIGLYWVLIESVQLRHAPFIFWIQDLSTKDPYYILPVLMGLSMFLQQRLNPPPPDPVQAKVMMLMPVIFTVLFINFPAGLMLYWFVNNTLSFLQQWYIMRSLDKSSKK